jgi:hypothetical protein
MATINYSFTIAGSLGSQTVELIKCSDSSVIHSEATTHTDGNITGSLTIANNLLVIGATYKVKITEGTAVQESSCFNGFCSYAYDLVTPTSNHVDNAAACADNGTGNTVVYGDNSNSLTNSKFYSDVNLTTAYAGTSYYFRYQVQGSGGSVTGYVDGSGNITNIVTCA